jgi:predicted RNase H-like nuclease
MVEVLGVDGCRGGWLVLGKPLGAELRAVEARVCASAAGFLDDLGRDDRCAIDMPIGLPSTRADAPRACEAAARALLGPRNRSVFPVPSREILAAREFRGGLGISLQSFHLLPRIRDLDAAMTPQRQRRAAEFHPELCFRGLTGAPAEHSKKTAAGRAERLAALRTAPGFGDVDAVVAGLRGCFRSRDVATDDILDALLLLAAAERWTRGARRRLPGPRPPRDARGLCMEISW